MKDIDLSSYSVEDLNELVDMAKKEIVRKEQTRLQDVRKQMEQLASSVGKSIQDFAGMDRKKKGVKTVGEAKYRNPNDPEQTWTGRGKRPRWLQDALDQGAELDEFRI